RTGHYWRHFGLYLCRQRKRECRQKRQCQYTEFQISHLCPFLQITVRPFHCVSSLTKESWREVFQIAPPCLPFVVGARGFVIDILDASAIQRFLKIVNPLIHPLRFFRADAYPHQADFFIEGRRVVHDAAKAVLRSTGPPPMPPPEPLNPPM